MRFWIIKHIKYNGMMYDTRGRNGTNQSQIYFAS